MTYSFSEDSSKSTSTSRSMYYYTSLVSKPVLVTLIFLHLLIFPVHIMIIRIFRVEKDLVEFFSAGNNARNVKVATKAEKHQQRPRRSHARMPRTGLGLDWDPTLTKENSSPQKQYNCLWWSHVHNMKQRF